MLYTPFEIKETVDMFLRQKLDIRAITLGISLLDCASASGVESRRRIRDKLLRIAGSLVKIGDEIRDRIRYSHNQQASICDTHSNGGRGFRRD